MTDPSYHADPPREPQRLAPQPVAAYADSRRKSPLLALVLSGMPGLGQIYVGYYQSGFVHAVIVAALLALLNSPGFEGSPLFPLFAVFMAFFWLYSMIDAFRRASLYNHALAGGREIALPDDISVPTVRGSIAGGVAIAAVGLILLLNTRFGMSLEWIEQWWPAAILLFGAYLAWKGVQERQKQQARESVSDDEL
jgi:phosphatidylserine synthase